MEQQIRQVKGNFVTLTLYKEDNNDIIFNVKAEDGTNMSFAEHELVELKGILNNLY